MANNLLVSQQVAFSEKILLRTFSMAGGTKQKQNHKTFSLCTCRSVLFQVETHLI